VNQQILIGLDIGTTNIKAVALDERGSLLAKESVGIATTAPRPGWVEQSPEDVVSGSIACVQRLLSVSGFDAGHVISLGIANHTETLVVWDRFSGQSVLPAIIWQCRRGAAEIEPLRTPDNLSFIQSKTGLDLDPTFTAAKLRWVFANKPDIADGLRTGKLLFGTIDTWLMWILTGGNTYATEPGNASRTMLMDIDRVQFDPELLSLFSLEIAELPECRTSHALFGETETSFFGKPIPIHAVLGDQQAALFGHGCFSEGQLKVSYGTGAFLWMNAGFEGRQGPGAGILRTIAWQIDRPCYAYEGFVMYAGKILEWLAQRLAIDGGAQAVARCAEGAKNSGGVLLVPAFQGLASPWWEPDVRAAYVGMSEATSVDNMAHAGLEAVGYQVRVILDLLRQTLGEELSDIRTDGGMGNSAYFTQLQANILQCPLKVSKASSMPAIGVALMAGLGAQVWSSLDEVGKAAPKSKTVSPQVEASPHYEETYQEWQALVTLLAKHYGESR